MKRYSKIKIQSSETVKYRWAFRMLFISISMSIFFGFISQTLLSEMGAIIAALGIAFFIFLSVIFDMVGIAAASADLEVFQKWNKEGVVGSKAGLNLCTNSEKVCSFCADVVGDICSTLCGAGGACIISSISKNINNVNIITIVSILMSACIAGLMVFFKALVKARTLKNSNRIILKIGVFLEKTIYKEKNHKNNKKI